MDNNFSNQTHLRNDLGADELDIVEITIALENQYDIIIQDEDMAQFITIDDIVNYIEHNTPNIKEKKSSNYKWRGWNCFHKSCSIPSTRKL